MANEIEVEIQSQYAPLLGMKEKRYKLYYGGRAGGKSYGFADAILILGRQKRMLIACVREVQNSLKDSVYQLLKDRCERWGFKDYVFFEDRIENYLTKTRIIFKGLSNDNAQNIKSLEGVDICWCFVAGTLIDGKPIEQLKTGDYVWSYNHETNQYQYNRVLRVTRRKSPKTLYKLLTQDGLNCIIATGNHPVYVKGKGYIPLEEVKKGDTVYAEEVRPSGICTLFRWLWRDDTDKHGRKKKKICKKWWGLLLGLCKEDKFRENEEKQSNVKPGNFGEVKKDFFRKEYTSESFGRKWSWLYKSSEDVSKGFRAWLVAGINNSNGSSQRFTNELQSGPCEYILRDSHRDRWGKSLWRKIKVRGQEKRRILKEQKVESVKIYEQRNLKRLGISDEGNYVYNLEVEGTHNYFANGLLVHNCEEAQTISKKSWEILDPTIRKPGSQIWVSMNRELESDPIWVAIAKSPDDKTYVKRVNYTDNIYCPDDIKYIAEKCKKENYEDYLHVWWGEPVQQGDLKLIGYPEVHKALEAKVEMTSPQPLVIGVDVARFGDDKTAIARREGRKAYKIETLSKLDTVQVANRVVSIINEENPARVNVDVGGLGAGIVDILYDRGYRNVVRAVNFGEKAQEQERYCNRRAEMWGRLKEWLTGELPVSLVDCEGLAEDLTSPNKKFDSLGRLLLEKKEDIKKRIGRSTDVGDALALTFAELSYPTSIMFENYQTDYVDDNVYVE